MTGIAITGWGSALPEKIVTNDDLTAYLVTSDEWISERTGIKERRFGSTTSQLAIEAGKEAIETAGINGQDIDLVLLATSTPDQTMPPTSATIQNALGIKGGAMDINVACSGFVYALEAARGMILGGKNKILVIGADTVSKITDQTDRNTAVLFADGAGAVVLERTSGSDQMLASDLGSEGSLASILSCDTGGFIQMNGKEVYRQAVLMVVESVKTVCQQAGIKTSDIQHFIAHQANIRIIQAVMERLEIPLERAVIVLDKTGNTSAASIPLALSSAADAQKINQNELVVFCGFGAGMTWATQLWRWGK